MASWIAPIFNNLPHSQYCFTSYRGFSDATFLFVKQWKIWFLCVTSHTKPTVACKLGKVRLSWIVHISFESRCCLNIVHLHIISQIYWVSSELHDLQEFIHCIIHCRIESLSIENQGFLLSNLKAEILRFLLNTDLEKLSNEMRTLKILWISQ